MRSEREVRGAGLVLQTVWGYKELRRTLEKDGWKKTDFMVNLNPPSNTTRANGGYEDSTQPLIDKGQDSFTSPGEMQRMDWASTVLYKKLSHFFKKSLLCLSTGGKGEREMIPMNDMGPGKCESREHAHTVSAFNY